MPLGSKKMFHHQIHLVLWHYLLMLELHHYQKKMLTTLELLALNQLHEPH
jgi:hypothetical protein